MAVRIGSENGTRITWIVDGPSAIGKLPDRPANASGLAERSWDGEEVGEASDSPAQHRTPSTGKGGSGTPRTISPNN